MQEQMALLERQKEGKQTLYLSISSGKGGVGKTLLTVHTGKIIADKGKKVLIIDGDLGLSNVHLMLGIASPKNLYDFLKGECSMDEIVVPLNENLSFISSGSGIKDMVNLPEAQLKALLWRLKEFAERSYDYVIFDTPPGIHSDTIALVSSSHIPIIITTPEPTAVADAYGLIKVLNKEENVKEFCIIVNKVSSREEGNKVYETISTLCEKFTTASVKYLGSISYNPKLIRRIVRQDPFDDTLIRELSLALSKLPLDVEPLRLNFWERLFNRLRLRS
ncbi:MinD/ParA family protein [Thermocrinis minervae]|uniref:Flagellar biosynthesis protein FlhG n=1 Tax=Thermocrinis minervae TaxID=381751 RepID=A0A1M6T6V5_9AQUI|nr:MinD/ParA family protein [Thermocrinis minervae]SHK52737.1 flagellar biosynthesis protein FlhG [Thermocrinis minervae]